MKKLILRITILCSILFSLSECKKKKSDPDAAPAPIENNYSYNAELQSSKDISFATLVISDIDMLCSFVGENNLFDNYFVPPSAGQGTVQFIHNASNKTLIASFNKTFCRDGKTRDGSVFFDFKPDPANNPNANPNATFYRDFGFSAKVNLAGYKVDGWLIRLFDETKPAFFQNKVATATFDPSATNLSWEIRGKFLFLHPADSMRNIVWEGIITKTLTNTFDPMVFAKNKQSAINWKLAKVDYSGAVIGKTKNNVPFIYKISTKTALRRDFTCAFVPSGSSANIAVHPFIGGAATFTTSNFHPRTIDHGPPNACDNTGTISFKGETHTTTFE